jgi:hypothetical protein
VATAGTEKLGTGFSGNYFAAAAVWLGGKADFPGWRRGRSIFAARK